MHAPEMRIAADHGQGACVAGAFGGDQYRDREKAHVADECRKLLSKAPGVTLEDDPANKKYPMPL